MPQFKYRETSILYEVVRTGRRTLCIEIQPGGTVVVRAPHRASQRSIEEMLRAKARWVLKHLSTTPLPAPHRYQDGEVFPFAGIDYRLVIIPGSQYLDVELVGRQILVSTNGHGDSRAVRQILLGWYVSRAREQLLARASELAAFTGIVPSRARVTRVREGRSARWGSCSTKASVNLNWRLVMAPPKVADYVILHELCHIRAPNHSRSFWELLGGFDPDFSQHREWLKLNGPRLEL